MGWKQKFAQEKYDVGLGLPPIFWTYEKKFLLNISICHPYF